MGILDEARQEPLIKGPRCKIWSTRAAMSAEDRAELDLAMAEQTITSRAISSVLARRKIHISAETISRHRRGQCLCGSMEAEA